MAATAPVILPIRQRTPAWEEARLDGIGSSEAAAAIGVSDWDSRYALWSRKLGLIPPREQSLNMRVGQEMEPLIARLYEEETGVRIRRATQLRRHPRHAFMLASLDRRAGRKPVELKWTARGTGYGEPGSDEVPDDTLAQVLHQALVVDEPEADVAAVIGGRELRIYTIRRDRVADEEIVEREAELWAHVESRTEPPIDGSEATRRVLAERYPRDTGEVVEADDELRDALTRLRAVRRNEAAIAASRDELEARIKARMAEASLLRAEGIGEIAWRATKDRETTDWKAIAVAYRFLLEQAGIPTDFAAVEGIHTNLAAGTRRFGPPRWEGDE